MHILKGDGFNEHELLRTILYMRYRVIWKNICGTPLEAIQFVLHFWNFICTGFVFLEKKIFNQTLLTVECWNLTQTLLYHVTLQSLISNYKITYNFVYYKILSAYT